MHPDHKQKSNRNGCGLVGNIKVCIWARFFSLDQGLSRNLSFLPYLERWDLLDISRTLYAEVHDEKFTPKLVYYLLLKFENFLDINSLSYGYLVHCSESIFIVLVHLFPHITHHIIASDGRPCLRENVLPASYIILSIYCFLRFELWSILCPSFFWNFKISTWQPTHFVA